LTEEEAGELVFVVDVTSFTKRGFIGSSKFAGGRVDIEFDDGGRGLTLSSEMCKKIRARTGSEVLIIGENEDKPQTSESFVQSVGEKLRISDAKTYYLVGRYGGAIIRIRKR